MRIATAVVIWIAFVAGWAFAEMPKNCRASRAIVHRRKTAHPRSLSFADLVRIAEVRYSKATDAVAALKRNRIASVRVLICPLTHRENVDKLVDALVAADIGVSTKTVASSEYMCADNARVDTRTGT